MDKLSQNQFLARMKKAKENVNKFQNVPIGTYFCQLKEVKYAPSKSGKEMVQFIYLVLEGDYRNREHRNFYMIGSDSDVPFNMLIQDIASLGYPTDEISSMDAMLALFKQIGDDRLHVNIRISDNPDPQYSQYPRTKIEEVVDVIDASDVPDAVPAPVEVEVEEADVTKPKLSQTLDVAEPEVEVEVESESGDVVEEEEEELDIDVGTKVKFNFSGKTMIGTIESGSADGLTCIVICEDGKKRKVKCDNITDVVK